MNVCNNILVTLEDNILYVDFVNYDYSSGEIEIYLTFEYENKTKHDVNYVYNNLVKKFGKIVMC